MDLDKIYNEDCLQGMKSLPDNSVDLVCTDVPYNETDKKTEGGLRKLHKGFADSAEFDLLGVLSEMWRVCRGSFYIFCGTGQISAIHNFFLSKGVSTRSIIWEKTNPSPMNGDFTWLSGIELCVFAKKSGAVFNLHCKNTVLRHPVAEPTGHPTPKPVNLMRQLILASSNKGDIVLDPFMGGGTTAVACVRDGRHYIGYELDKDYYELCCKRVECEKMQLTFDFE